MWKCSCMLGHLLLQPQRSGIKHRPGGIKTKPVSCMFAMLFYVWARNLTVCGQVTGSLDDPWAGGLCGHWVLMVSKYWATSEKAKPDEIFTDGRLQRHKHVP